MLEWLEKLDVQLFFAINSRHNAFFDVVFYWISNAYVWIPLYVALFYLLVKIYGFKTSCFLLLAAGLAVGMADLVSVYGFKNMVARYRPSQNMAYGKWVHVVYDHRGGMYGFVSSHAANFGAWTLFMFFALKRKHWKKLAVVLLLLPLVVGYSRVYLGVHYPGDVFCGWVLGAVFGMAAWMIVKKMYLNRFEEAVGGQQRK